MRVRWQRVSLLMMTLLTLTVWPAAGVQAQPTAGRDTVVIGMSQEPDFLNPMFVEMAAARGVQATIFTDEFASYSAIPKMEGMGYQHRRINHSQKVYVSGDVHTNTIEGFWSLVNAESAACTTRSARSIYRATLTSIRFGITAAIPGI